MSRRRIVILGGGMAGLSAAYELTRTSELQAANDVTVYQMGWRLGGKAASGRDRQGRNLEHGLHVWFGFYENTFRLLREVYDARDPQQDWAFKSWRDAVKPQNMTPIGIKEDDGSWRYWPLVWATNDAVPGDGGLLPSLPEMIETALDWLWLFLSGQDTLEASVMLERLGPPPTAAPVTPTPAGALAAARDRLSGACAMAFNEFRGAFAHVIDLVGWAHAAHAATCDVPRIDTQEHSILCELLNIALAALNGIFRELVLEDKRLVDLDDEEFRDWLIRHGANHEIVASSSFVRVLYDTAFQYVDGDSNRPDMAAGTALGSILRIVATYKGACMWEVQAGMGEVMVGPLYQQLVSNGVKFEFFHKVTAIEAGEDGGKPVVSKIRIERQAETIAGAYEPVTMSDGLVHWPYEPDWDQLRNGQAMRDAGVNFESNWVDWPAAGEVVLENGRDFDTVVLAIALGALKSLNPEDPSPCQSLMDANPRFSDWINEIGLVPSMGVQLWCNRTTAELGWTRDKPAVVSGPEYLNIWADMTQVVAHEGWPAPAPGSLHYLCGTYATTLYRAPKSDKGAPARALADVRVQAVGWLHTATPVLWPDAQAPGGFDWSVLVAPAGVEGEARLDAQYLRANIDPTECTTLSAAGKSRFRLHADESGFANLFLAGEGTAMGLATSFEGAIISGAAASRAICGSPEIIVGYDFLERRLSEGAC